MPRRQTRLVVGQYYHVYNRGNNRQPVFLERENYRFFLRQLRRYLHKDAVEIVAYCLMPNHYHLLVFLLSDRFSRQMHRLGTSYTKAINERHARVGSLFQGRFQAIQVDRLEHLLHLSRYIHLNPVEAGLVRAAIEWDFSSYPEYLGVRNGTLPQPDRLLREFASREAYRDFVESTEERNRVSIAHLLFD